VLALECWEAAAEVETGPAGGGIGASVPSAP
jgi:hypothetical protein